jgi:hypothetical protein
VLAIGLTLALSMGIIDVCVALLNKPHGFETLAAVPPSILATAAVLLPLYGALWVVLRAVGARAHLRAESLPPALAVALGTASTLTVLIGLHTMPLKPQTVFRAGMVLAQSVIMGAGAYPSTSRFGEETADATGIADRRRPSNRPVGAAPVRMGAGLFHRPLFLGCRRRSL